MGLFLALSVAVTAAGAEPSSIASFESGLVRPLALSRDRSRLFVLNTPDNRLEIFSLSGAEPSQVDSVRVGLEPVAVAVRSADEVWVVNHLSDSISIIDVASHPARVVRTLLVGDEPRDIVFAGPKDPDGNFLRAFVTTARRGQNLPASVPANLTVPGTPRALVWVFDTENLGTSLGGAPEAVVELFGDTPRALAASADGRKVFAAVFHSGNQTTSVAEGAVCNGGTNAPACGVDGVQVPGGLGGALVPGGLPAPNVNRQGAPGPETGLIVKFNRNTLHWEDRLGRNWTNAVRFDLPDLDVFELDALASPPSETQAFAHVGTVLFNMAVDPVTQKLYVSNTDAQNEVRFEGPGLSATTVRGHLHEARITVIDEEGVHPRHINKHIAALPEAYRTDPMPAHVAADSLATPGSLAISSDGTLYVAAFGSSQIGRFRIRELDEDSFVPSAADHIALTGGGPAGLALDEAADRLFVLTRFDNALVVVDTAENRETSRRPLHNPESAVVVSGRPFLYDARLSSSNGEASCSACHVFGDFDSLAWDLGNPDASVASSFNPTGPLGSNQPFHPMKGPMTTQTLRGLSTQGPMHWRGDRSGGRFLDDPAALDELLAFEAFNGAFGDLLGRDEGEIPAGDMEAFARFALAIQMPPNPIRSLNNQLTPAQSRGRRIYLDRPGTDGITNCNGCHVLDAARGFFGTGGETTFENEPQEFKVAPLRNAYQKVGMFGMPNVSFVNLPPAATRHQGDQVRGFGFLHDGSIATANDFLHASVFALNEGERSDLEQFIFGFDSTFAPIVGQQATLAADSGADVQARVDLLVARASTPFVLIDHPGARECDLVASGTVSGEARGFLLQSDGKFQSDRAGEPPVGDAELRALVKSADQELTFTCVPPGSGPRIALDRDEDGFFDRDELDAGSDPSDPLDTPAMAHCPGDCDRDGAVTVDEIVRAVDIALGQTSATTCPSADSSGDGRVSVDEIIQAVTAALEGCR